MSEPITYLIDTQYHVVPCRKAGEGHLRPAADCPDCDFYSERILTVPASEGKWDDQFDIRCGFPRLIPTHKMFINNKCDLFVTCSKGVPSMIISMDDCEKCDLHRGFTADPKRGILIKCGRLSNVREIMYSKPIIDKGGA